MNEQQPSCEQLQRRLADAEKVIRALRTGQVDAIVSERDVALVRLSEAEAQLQQLNAELEQRIRERTAQLEQSNRVLAGAMTELQEAQLQMLNVQRLAMLGTVTAEIAHEVNNPLMGVMNALAFARRRATDATVAAALEDARHELERLADIVRDLLRFGRVSSPPAEQADLPSVLQRTIALLEPEFHTLRIALSVDLPADLPLVRGDASRLQQMFLNLLLNARDAVRQRQERRVALQARQEGSMVFVEISDTGVGIPESDQPRIFDAFYTTKREDGTGLGLSIARGVAEGVGGRIEVRSVAGEGATFTVWLPLARPEPEECNGKTDPDHRR